MLTYKVITKNQAQKGEFPLHHEVILKVRFYQGCPVRDAFISSTILASRDLSFMLSQLPNVRYVKISSVDDLDSII